MKPDRKKSDIRSACKAQLIMNNMKHINKGLEGTVTSDTSLETNGSSHQASSDVLTHRPQTILVPPKRHKTEPIGNAFESTSSLP